ncbi:MAG: pentapeptide repeat-containing protein [Okeania sp. SIO2F4]|uniref:pentapeptide repeat-containing protein n=1 Tax=Okeania sp. SIO2F4 TaxID=2607790 RepID=UPI00142C3EBB|nr:pentapeptide repeat-containing protein [Okeania sp. SIO2F4]NES06444.1 pentapeptide repeat-containing protein [Okeania sp. SIO2F4]
MNIKFIAAGLGTLTAFSLSLSEANLGQAQTVENTINYPQIELEDNSIETDSVNYTQMEFDWEELWEQINSLPLFRYTTGITLIFFLIFVLAIWREKELKLNPITMRHERVNLITYFNNLLSSIAKKEPWEIFEKIFVPIFIGLIASFIAYDLEQLEEKISDKRFHEQILANYMKEIRQILLEQERINVERKKINPNNIDRDNQEIFNGLIQANTWNLALRLEDDAKLKGLLLLFLYETRLILCQTDLDCNQIDLQSINLENVQLISDYLKDANLTGANLSNAKFEDVVLVNSDLSHATLVGSKWRGSRLRDANLSHAKLNNADLRGADLSGADLSHADLTGAKIDKTTMLLFATFCKTTMPNGTREDKNCPAN